MNHKSENDVEKSSPESEFLLGVPNQEAPQDDPLAVAPVKASPPRDRRTVEQWESLGVPDQTTEEFERVGPEESRLLRPVEAHVKTDEEREPDLETDFWRELAGNPTAIAILILLTCLILLAVGAQVLTLVTQLAMVTGGVRLIGYAATGILVALSLWAIVRLVNLYFRLRSSEPISLRDLTELRQRARLRSEGLRRDREACRKLAPLLEAYPLGGRRDKAQLLKLGATPQQIEELTRSRRWLLANGRGTSEGWFENFNRKFLHHLDEIADQRISVYAKRLVLRTGAAHQRTIDTMIVMTNAYLRAGKWGTARILGHVFVNTFAASRVDQWSDAMADHAANLISQHLPHAANAASQLAESAGVGMVAKLAPRIASGAANGMLLYRLGKTTVRELRPVQEKPGDK
jgi:uncharacterized membrane protein YcjF (UPF0283 family)